MYILDTDHFTLIQRKGQEGRRILGRFAAMGEAEFVVTVITYEEQVRGRLNLLSRAKTLDERVFAYQGLQTLALDYSLLTILPFNRSAALEHERLRKVYPRLGTIDLRIAAITLVYGATLLSRNLRDFGRVEGLRVEDWTIAGEKG